jgi:hypothetical protein
MGSLAGMGDLFSLCGFSLIFTCQGKNEGLL